MRTKKDKELGKRAALLCHVYSSEDKLKEPSIQFAEDILETINSRREELIEKIKNGVREFVIIIKINPDDKSNS